MTTHSTLQERIKVIVTGAVINADITTERISSYLPMRHFGRVAAVLIADGVTLGKTASVQILQATDDSGSNPKDLVTVTSDALGGNKVVVAEASQEEMDGENGYTHVAVRAISNDNAACPGAAVLFRADGNYKPVSAVN